MYDIADKIIELRLATRKACMCEGSCNKSTLNLKTKVLFLIDKGYSAKDIIATLSIAKTNLALLTSALEKDGLIKKIQRARDKREKAYYITEKGETFLYERKRVINDSFARIFSDDEQFDDACAKVDEVLSLLSFIGE